VCGDTETNSLSADIGIYIFFKLENIVAFYHRNLRGVSVQIIFLPVCGISAKNQCLFKRLLNYFYADLKNIYSV
ncbi:MAG: hypothetical protein MUC87_03470, partial [Bacteroidia bacterium]|nr:hypothetical protein [Bacteroidia bacterium]